jgi:urease accessory protein
MLARVLQLASPALPVGAYAFSEGLEYAVEAQWVRSAEDARTWIGGLLEHSVTRLDVPMFGRMYEAWESADETQVRQHSAYLLANRETAELRNGDRAMGQALARILESLNSPHAKAWRTQPKCTYAAMLALACIEWGVSKSDGAQTLAWSWVENQVAAAIKLIPLGQSDGQRLLFEFGQNISMLCALGLTLDDDAIGGSAPGLAIASSQHESQHTRLFRS